MSGCYTCGGYGMKHDPSAHDAERECTCVPHPYGGGVEEYCPVHGRWSPDPEGEPKLS